MPPPEGNARVASLLERLLTDAQFRARFRREPIAVCHEFGLLDVAEELESSGKALHTLEMRESKSSLAGVLMAAAAEGVGVVELARYVHSSRSLSPEAVGAVNRALSSPKLQAVGAPPGGASVAPPDVAAPSNGPAAPTGAALVDSHQAAPTAGPVPEAPPSPAAPPPAGGGAAEAAASAGAAPSAADELLQNPRVHFSPAAQAELAARAPDPRLVSVLATVSQQHDVTISALKDGGFEIASVDGKPVDPSNIAARDLAEALGALQGSDRPSEVGSPWPISAPGYFSDGEHQNVIHVGYSAAPPPAAEPAAGPPPVATPPAEAPPPVAAPPVAPPPAAPQPAGSGVMAAVADPGPSSRRGTLQFAAVAEQHAGATPGAADAFDVLPDGSDAYPGDNAPKEQIAAWMARQAHKAGLPGELPVMASLVESGVTNVQGGDRDSVGFFQMRTGIWDEGPYKGFQHRPELQLKWFLDHALEVKKERLARGDTAFLHDPKKWGDWIADVERPAAEYRGRYQLRLDEAKSLLHQAGPPAPTPAAAEHAAPAAAAAVDQLAAPSSADPNHVRALAAIAIAKKYLGTPYHWGGSDPSTGFDCSGIVQYAYKQVGVDLPRVTYTQVNVGEHIDRAHLQPGDVLFFRDSSGDIHHEAMYIGGGKFLHAPHTGDVIKISSLDEPYYKEQFMGGRRVAQLAHPGAAIPKLPGVPAVSAASPPPVAADGGVPPPAAPAPGGSGVLQAVGSEPAPPQPRGTLQFAAVADQHAGASAPGAADALGVLPDGSDAYPGDAAPKPQIAAWMARQAHKAGLPAELPAMASLVESGMTNIQGGDRDSVGFFQMRTGIWDEGPYKGFEHKPELQLKWFIDHALEVKKERLARGDATFLHDSSKWGDWIADVERPAEQYRGRYQLRLDEARGLLHQAGPPAPTPAALQHAAPAAAEQLAPAAPGDPAQTRALAALAIARKYLGTPYKWGGADPSTGFDCSGIVQYAYKQVGVDLPRVTYTQVNVGEHIDRAHLQPGDILFFRDSTGDIHHEAMYVGGGKFLHAPHTGDVIKISSLDEPYYKEQFMGGRRVAQLAHAGAPIPHVPGMAAPAASPPPVVPPADAPVTPPPVVAPPAAPPPGGSSVLQAVGSEPAPAPPRSTVKFMPAVDPSASTRPTVDPSHPAGSSASAAADVASSIPPGPDAYPGDNAPKEQLAAWMARAAHKAGLPGELPVMAALVESTLHNHPGGDADSAGFFQMRQGIWDKGEYAGFQHKPELQLKWFIDHALEVKRQRIARGESAFVNDPSRWGDWIADVERPAEQYRGRYQLHLGEARKLLGGG